MTIGYNLQYKLKFKYSRGNSEDLCKVGFPKAGFRGTRRENVLRNIWRYEGMTHRILKIRFIVALLAAVLAVPALPAFAQA
ncbi:MAG: hypothetical protein WBD10_16170, partial [Acidobacteriaceae bacterium]